MVSGSLRSGILGCGTGSLANRLPSPSGVLAHERMAARLAFPVRMWLKRGLPCQKLHCPPRLIMPLTCEEDDVNAVMIAVDPHKASNTAAVLDPVTKTLIESARFANTADGYVQLAGFAARWEQRRRAVEGCFGAGRSLAQRLVADGEAVLDVPAKLAARVRVYSQGHGRKTDKDDAVSVGLAALDGTGIRPVTPDGDLVSLRLLRPA